MKEKDLNFISAVTESATSIADTVRQLVYENPTKKSEYALDEKVKDKILNDKSIPYEDRLIMCYGYSKIKRMFNRRRDVLELAEKYFAKGKENFNKKIDEIDADWFDFFIEKVENTSDERFKSLWAKLLATQLNSTHYEEPLTISKKLISTICLMSNEDISTFYSICSMTLDSLDRQISKYPFIYVRESAKFLAINNLRRFNLASLAQLGLIEYNGPETSFVLPKKIPRLRYHNTLIEFKDLNNDDRINTGNVRLTADGRVLYDLTKGTYISGFLNVCKSVWDEKEYQYTINEIST